MLRPYNDTKDLDTKIEKVREELEAIRSIRKVNETRDQQELVAASRKFDRTKSNLNELLEVGKHGHTSIRHYAESLKRMHETTGEAVIPSYVLNLEARLVQCLHHMGNLHMQKKQAANHAERLQKEIHKMIAKLAEQGSIVEMQLINSILKEENEMAETQERYLDRISHEHWIAPVDRSLEPSSEQQGFQHEQDEDRKEEPLSKETCSRVQEDVKLAQKQIEKTVDNIVTIIKGIPLKKQNSQRMPKLSFHPPPQVRAHAC
mmetsp:Transcript_12963/g.18347  ORF Transcript_12963/g.18347 Transcript_12963/m.18347 type:complete len:261 (-) Transcript_12963:57-839(-)